MPGPLEGLRVVELAIAIQGPAAGLYFANMGADVIKVEPPMGDASRYHRGVNYETLAADALCSQFLAMNKTKRSVTLDLHTELGQSVMAKLLEGADVFLTNVREEALERMALGLADLTERYPRLVVGHVNGFGPLGDEGDKAMLDGAAQARGGIVSMSGRPGEAPTPPGSAIADHAGAMQLALGCVTGLVNRALTGRGQIVQTSSLGAQLWLQMWELQHSAITGVPLSRDGSHHPNLRAPYGTYMCKDGIPVLFVVAMTDESWAEFWIFFDKPEMILMEEWDTPGKRVGLAGSDEGLHEIRQNMREAFASKTFAEFAEFVAGQPEIIWERVRGHDEVLSDPQNLANEYVVDLDLPVTGTTPTVGTLMRFSETPTEHPKAPPVLGADTGEIMTELGFDAAAVEGVQAHCEATKAEMYAALLGDP